MSRMWRLSKGTFEVSAAAQLSDDIPGGLNINGFVQTNRVADLRMRDLDSEPGRR